MPNMKTEFAMVIRCAINLQVSSFDVMVRYAGHVANYGSYFDCAMAMESISTFVVFVMTPLQKLLRFTVQRISVLIPASKKVAVLSD